jgi:hypothetical protein
MHGEHSVKFITKQVSVVANFMLLLFYPQEKSWYPLNKRLGGPQIRARLLEKKKSLARLWIIMNYEMERKSMKLLMTYLRYTGIICVEELRMRRETCQRR